MEAEEKRGYKKRRVVNFEERLSFARFSFYPIFFPFCTPAFLPLPSMLMMQS